MPSFKDGKIAAGRVKEWIDTEGQNIKFRASNREVWSTDWLKEVDGALLLDELFQSLAVAKETYIKTAHAPMLTRWILDHDSNAIKELTDYVVDLTKLAA